MNRVSPVSLMNRISSFSSHNLKYTQRLFSTNQMSFRQQMKEIFQSLFVPAVVVYGSTYLTTLGAFFLALDMNIGSVIGLDYPTLLQKVRNELQFLISLIV